LANETTMKVTAVTFALNRQFKIMLSSLHKVHY